MATGDEAFPFEPAEGLWRWDEEGRGPALFERVGETERAIRVLEINRAETDRIVLILKRDIDRLESALAFLGLRIDPDGRLMEEE